MRFDIEPLSQSDAETIASWHYEGEYAFYDAEADAEDLAELLDPALRGDSMFAVRDDAGELVGFFAFQNLRRRRGFRSRSSSGSDGKGTGGAFCSCGTGFRANPVLAEDHSTSRRFASRRSTTAGDKGITNAWVGFQGEVERYMNRFCNERG